MKNNNYITVENNGLKEYYGNESKSFALGFAKWKEDNTMILNKAKRMYLLRNKSLEQKNNISYTLEELYDLYIKQLVI